MNGKQDITLTEPTSKAKIIWQCRRGMLELDLILNRFVALHWDALTAQQRSAFEQLLKFSDPEIHLWLMGNEVPSEQELVDIVTFIQLQYRI